VIGTGMSDFTVWLVPGIRLRSLVDTGNQTPQFGWYGESDSAVWVVRGVRLPLVTSTGESDSPL
jgi:hypothetical protein